MDRFSEETNVDPSVACVGLSVWTFRSVTMSQTVNIRAELPPGHLGRHNHTGGCAAVAHPARKRRCSPKVSGRPSSVHNGCALGRGSQYRDFRLDPWYPADGERACP